MGQKFEFDESMIEEIAYRISLIPKLAESLTFELARWKCSSLNPVPS